MCVRGFSGPGGLGKQTGITHNLKYIQMIHVTIMSHGIVVNNKLKYTTQI